MNNLFDECIFHQIELYLFAIRDCGLFLQQHHVPLLHRDKLEIESGLPVEAEICLFLGIVF